MPTIYNKVVLDGTTLMDISDTTATASDVALGKQFYTTAGVKTEGTAVGGGNAISVVDTTDSHGGTIRTITAVDISDTTAIASDVASGKYFYTSNGTKTLGTASGGSGGTGQTATGTVTGDGTSVLEIPCNFEPDLIYVYGDMSGDVANRGIISLTIIKDASIYVGADTSTSSIQENATSIHGITGYNESDASNIHATYSNGTLTINTMSNSSSGRWRSGQVYNYELSTIGTGGGGTPSATQHTILFEFNDETTSTITAYYDSSFISDAITATTPTTYNGKTITLAQLDNVTWYEPTAIPLNTQLVDYTKCLQNTAIDSSGQEGTMEWYYASDYSPVAAGMTFTFTCGWWTNVAFYDSSKTFIRSFTVYDSDIATQDEQDSNLGHGTLTGNTIPSNAAYIRMASNSNNANYMSLIRTA